MIALFIACAELPPPPQASAEPVLISLSAPRLLRRISLDLRGTLPDVADLDTVEADPGALDAVVARYLDDPLHEERLVQLLADRWHTIAPAHDRIYRVKMSIDAATPATYETLRRGAKWSDLVRGLDLVRTLRESGRLAEFEATFVTRATNFRDVPAFVDLAIDHGATHVQFILLRQWPHIADDEFQRENLAHPDHPLRAEFEAILQDERLDHPHVHADNLKPALQTVIR